MSFLARVALATALVGLALALWQLRQVVLLLFGGLIFATALHSLAQPLRRAGLPQKRAAGLAMLLLAILALAAFWWIGDSIAAQLDALGAGLPRAAEFVRNWLGTLPFGSRLLQLWDEARGADISWLRVASVAGVSLHAFGNTLLMVLLGVYLALEPATYRGGLVRLAAPPVRRRLAEALDECGHALAKWLKGQAVSMLFVGVATGVGLALLGVPLALILGVLSGLLDFVPFFGPIAAGVLAVLFAFVQGPQVALYVAVLMLAIQQVEGNVLMPLLQKWAVQLPPVLGLISVVVFTGLFGLLGTLFATPLMVVLMVLVRRLYVEDYLEARAAGGR